MLITFLSEGMPNISTSCNYYQVHLTSGFGGKGTRALDGFRKAIIVKEENFHVDLTKIKLKTYIKGFVTL